MAMVLLGTIALEPNRWSGIAQERRSTISLSPWLDRIGAAGFDGIELWEPHLREAEPAEIDAILSHPLDIEVFNTYVGFDDDDDAERMAAAEWIRRSGARKVKWNTGPNRDAASLADYADRLIRWAAALPGVELVCECHDGSALDDPAAAAAVLTAGSNALVHSNDGADRLREKFAAYGDRITHVHVNHLDTGSPKLAEIRDDLAATVELLDELGFDGSWTIEFVHGTGGPDDAPGPMFAQAVEDLAVLRSLVG